MKNLFKRNFIFFTVVVIAILLAISILLTHYNNAIIERNRILQDEVETAKTYYDAVGKSVIHSVDIGLRGFAIVRDPQFSAPMDNAIVWTDSVLEGVETPLQKLHYNFEKYNIFKDSLKSYIHYAFHLKQLLMHQQEDEFIALFSRDKGGYLWYQYLELEKDIKNHLGHIDETAKQEYQAALFRNQVLQIVLFLICIPTLIYTAIHTAQTFKLSELLRLAEKERNKILLQQNVKLEKNVAQRTEQIESKNQEINSQSEELAAQRDTLLLQNKKLQEAHETIEKQHAEIRIMNQQLKKEVDRQTQQLKAANEELIGQNTQLEQFAFIAAHNLRAPLARILGLMNLMKLSTSEHDKMISFEKLEGATKDLDHVIQDLNIILNIRKHTSNFTDVGLASCFTRVKRMLEKEMEDTGSVIKADFSEVQEVYAVAPYVESILYNLISNAIKYRHPERKPVISIQTKSDSGFVCLSVKDNGLGIDLEKHKSNMFNLYKRFHLHMEGKGLGLYLVRTQVESLGGKIEVASKPNEGTTFLIYFNSHTT